MIEKMKKRPIIRIAVLTLVVGGVALAGVAVGGVTGGLHHPMHFAHGGPGMHLLINSLIDDLDLIENQQEQLDAVHEKISNHINGNMDQRAEHHQTLLAEIAAGSVDADKVKVAIDQHLEEGRLFAHEVADDLVVFVNSLDDAQRATLVEKVQRFHELMASFSTR